MKRLLLIGNSPVTFLTALELDRQLARQTHLEITWVTTEAGLVYWPDLSLPDLTPMLDPADKLAHVALRAEAVKGINLREQRVTLARGVIEYDWLFLDATPSYRASELKLLAASLEKLAVHLGASRSTVTARLALAGREAATWQLALAARAWLNRLGDRRIRVETNLPTNPTIKDFLRRQGLIQLQDRKVPGLTVREPSGPIALRLIRGLTLDKNSRAVVDRHWSPPNHSEVIILDQPSRVLQSLWRSDRTLARKIARQLDRLTEKQALQSFETLAPALLLNGVTETLLCLGSQTNQGLPAKAVYRLDQHFYRSTSHR